MFENALADMVVLEGVKAAAVVGKDGLVINFEAIDRSIDPELAAAMVAAAYGSASTVMERLMEGNSDIVIVEGNKGKVLLVDAGKEAMLAVLTEPKVNLGLIRLQMKRTAEKIASSL